MTSVKLKLKGQKMQKLLKFSFIISCLINIPIFASGEIGRIVAVVEDKIISQADLENRLKLAILSSGLENTPAHRKQLESQVIRVMVDELLKINRAKQFDIHASENDIEHAIKDIEHRNQMEEGTLKKLLQSNHIPLKILKTQMEADIVWREYIQARYYNSVQISERELERASEKFAQKKDQPQFLLAEIFLEVDASSQEADVERRAWEFVNKIRSGANFSAISQQFSQAASAAQSGDIDWVAADQLDPVLKQVIEGLNVGSTTDPIKTQHGYHILLLRDKRAAGESLGKDTLITFIQTLFPLSQPFTEETVNPVMLKARTLANSAKNCAVLSTLVKSDKNIEIREAKNLSFATLIPQIRQLIGSLNPGQSSTPLLSDAGVIMFTVCEKQDINPENLAKEQVRNILIEEKLNNLSKGELRELKRRAHVEIRD
ncbi:MAG: peptidylprolyl isomerase [Candidatus Paracaedimonas acanthamoebae]|uniref:Parvulin-like PPIase n=1 Tax=Candidatus Paracaedimonas acanthamoebae TaxID=244581 RepID=A0A8J7PGM6_9PROT|nr:peptidylprolyl isomerase [Candidatus Paracaedimonas acanthamoebae]